MSKSLHLLLLLFLLSSIQTHHHHHHKHNHNHNPKNQTSTSLQSNTPDYESIIRSFGYDFEEHFITTEDGYINSIWRIPSKSKKNYFLSNPNNNNKAILLQHGLLDDGWTWFALRENSLPYKLADLGYDVYINHVRGTLFSTGHIDPNKNYLNFIGPYWDFSFDEFAKFDLTSAINFAKKKSNCEKIDYIGHSQGTLIFFLKYMLNPDFMEKNINKFVGVGTVPNVNNAESYITKFVAEYGITEKIFVKNFMRLGIPLGKVISEVCNLIPNLCGLVVHKVVENDISTTHMDFPKIAKNIFLYEPGGTSIQNMRHWIQIFKSKKLLMFDYGSPKLNLEHYGSEFPPEYNQTLIENYNIKSLVTISNADPFCNPIDTIEFVGKMKKNVTEIFELNDYNHLDYVWGEDAVKDLYPKIYEFLKN